MSPGCMCQELLAGELPLSQRCLGQLWIFEQLSGEELRFLTEQALRKIFEPGQAIFMQGDSADKMFLIKSGRIKLSKVLEEGQEILLDIRKAGDFIGEYMLSENDARFPVSAWCMERTLICGFTQEIFERIVQERPNIGLQIIKRLGQQVSSLTTRVGSMSIPRLEDRLYRVLSNVAQEHGEQDSQGYIIQFPITHEDLSFLVGAHRVSITRALKSLRDSGRVIQEGKAMILPFENA